MTQMVEMVDYLEFERQKADLVKTLEKLRDMTKEEFARLNTEIVTLKEHNKDLRKIIQGCRGGGCQEELKERNKDAN